VGTNEPDGTANAGCFVCENPKCTCGKNDAYIKQLIACITEEVMNKLGN
jgi:hypothetical protein